MFREGRKRIGKGFGLRVAVGIDVPVRVGRGIDIERALAREDGPSSPQDAAR
jgi:hypothetical protein